MQIETERLQLSPIIEKDTQELHQIWLQPPVRQYLWDDSIVPFDETRSIVARNQTGLSQSLYGLWGVRKIGENPLIGFCGYWPFFEPPEIQLIYGLSSCYWGQGFAIEMVRAIVKYGFHTLGFTEIIASTDAPNQRSIALLEKLKAIQDKQKNMDGKETIFYKIDKEHFEKSTIN